MIGRVSIQLVIAWCLLGCSPEKPVEALEERTGVEKPLPRSVEPKVEEKVESDDQSGVAAAKIIGAGTLDGAGMSVEIAVDGKGEVTGELKSGSTVLTMAGSQREGTLRCWLAGRDSSGAVWRGALTGDCEAEKCSGEVTISDDAGEDSKRGGWKSE